MSWREVFHAVAVMFASIRSDDSDFKICIFGPRLHLRQNFWMFPDFSNLGYLDSAMFTSIRVAFPRSPARRVEDLCSENTIFFYNQHIVNLQMTLLSSSKLPAEKSARVP